MPSSLGDARVEEVIHPCNPNPCPSNNICQVNRKGCNDMSNCEPYLCEPGTLPPSHKHTHTPNPSPFTHLCVCVSGCKLGEASEFLVHQGTRTQVPSFSGVAGCYEVCTCGPSGRLENCVEMPCVETSKVCIVEGQRKSKTCLFF